MKSSARRRPSDRIDSQQLNRLAIAHHQAGRLEQARQLYRRVLAAQPRDFDALHLSGLLAHQQGDATQALELIARALRLRPNDPSAHNNFGNVLDALGRTDEAIASYREALCNQPDYPEAFNNLGASLDTQGKVGEAIDCYCKALELRPGYSDALHNLARALEARGDTEQAITAWRNAIAGDPQHVAAHFRLGLALAARDETEQAITLYRRTLAMAPRHSEAHFQLGYELARAGQLQEAADAYFRSVELRPEHAATRFNLGGVLYKLGRLRDALTCYQEALARQPDMPEAWYNLGVTLNALQEYDLALGCYRKAIALRPDYPEAHNNMGNTLRTQGKLDAALHCYRQALALTGGSDMYSNILQTLMYSPSCAPLELYAETCEFAVRYEAPLRGTRLPHANSPQPDRRLRVGYVSGDFFNHSIAYFIEPVLANHDRSQFEVYAYYNHTEHDVYTERIKKMVDHWLPCHALTDEELAARIRADSIDILVDLSGHSARHRLLCFARKPAPVQATWMGTPGSTGLQSMDYKISNDQMDPPGMTEHLHSEKLLRLPASAAYRAPEFSPPVNRLPALDSGVFTLSCLNNLAKITPQVVALWARILTALPRARLVLGNADGAGTQEHLAGLFSPHGIGIERLVLQPKVNLPEFMALHLHIDLALDPFPYAGGTTTRHALWMGVPVVTMVGDSPASRVGSAILTRAGFTEFITQNGDEYVETVLRTASDLPRLDQIRQSLRARLSTDSRYSDVAFTRALEQALRGAWQTWCAQQTAKEMQ